MAGISSKPRDLRALSEGLRKWLAEQWTDRQLVDISEFRTSPHNGFSSESLMFEVTTVSGAGERSAESLVVRLPPQGEGIFRTYDLGLQYHVQQLMANAGVPVPRQIGHCPDDSWIGSPFLVMEFVVGRVPSNQPTYNVTGWLKDIPAERQASGHANVLAAMSRIHTADFSAEDSKVMRRPSGIGLAAEVAWYRDCVSWATDNDPPADVAALTTWCVERMPYVAAPDAICWGDARLGNVIFRDDMSVGALLDWEMATCCPAELDIGWFLGFRRQIRARTGVTAATELPGFPERNAVIVQYEALLGRSLVDVEWFEAFAMLRLAGLTLSTKRLVRRLGITEHFIFGFAPVEPWVLEIINK